MTRERNSGTDPPTEIRSLTHLDPIHVLSLLLLLLPLLRSGLLQCYAHWKNKRHMLPSVFDLFFRVHPFNGEFTVFAGLEEVLRFITNFAFTDADMLVLGRKFGAQWDPEFFQWLRATDMSQVKLYAVREGSVVFPRLPLIRVEGPLGICQMLESTLLVLVNYASLVTTNAARHRLAVGPTKTLLEFGLRRAQGPDGAMSASRYSYMGGFDGTSNVKAVSGDSSSSGNGSSRGGVELSNTET